MFFAWGWETHISACSGCIVSPSWGARNMKTGLLPGGIPDSGIRSKENECLDTVLRSATSAVAS